MIKLVFALVIPFLLMACPQMESMTGTSTYIIPMETYNEIQQELKIKDCPFGTNAIAVVVESQGGGGTITVRCQ